MDKLDSIRKCGIKAQGQKELVSYLKGGKLTLRQAVKAACYDCMGYYADGKEDCQTITCPLYPFNPYNPNKQKSRVMSDEKKAILSRRMKQQHTSGKIARKTGM